MRTYPECMVCFLRQGLDTIKLFTNDKTLHEKVIKEILKECLRFDTQLPPPVMGGKVQKIIKNILRVDDPFRDIKIRSNKFVKGLLPKIKDHLETKDRLKTAIKLSIAGNVIDYGIRVDITEEQIIDSIINTLTMQIDNKLIENLKEAAEEARSILFIADNAGEIILDRFLIEELSCQKTVLAVKASPMINDATIEDAKEAGLTELVKVITTGCDLPGIIPSACSEEFLSEFNRADLIIAKGQGNFETLNDLPRPIWFLLKAKCSVVAEFLNVPQNTPLILGPKVHR